MGKEGSSEDTRIEQELTEDRPFYLYALNAFLIVFFLIYDAVVFIPFKIFADPEKKRERSERVKAQPVDKNDPSSPWRHVDTFDTGLWNEIFPGCDTLGKLWDEAARRNADGLCMGTRQVEKVTEERQKDGRSFQKLILGNYEWMDYTEVDEIIAEITNGLRSLGLKKGDHVVIYAETRAEWMQTAIACFKCGLPVVTVYATLGEEAVEFAMKECDAVAVFTTRSLLSKVASATKECPSIKNVIYFSELYQEPGEDREADEKTIKQVTNSGRQIYFFDSLVEMGANSKDNRKVDVNPDDLAMIMYTSGTTGNPKGVMLSHRNIIAATAGQSVPIPVGVNDIFIGYLPLAHILEVCAELVVLAKGCRIGYSSAQTLFDRAPKIQKGSKGDCAALKPTLMACVPAVMDRIFKAVTDEVKSKPPIFRELFRICYERKRGRYEEGYTSLVMNKLAFDRIRKLLGGKLRFVLSGGAPLSPETQRFMNICFCCPVVQGYGLTETFGGATLAAAMLRTIGFASPVRAGGLTVVRYCSAFASNVR
jgi:long-chain acyl-CoA synthetase